MFMVQTLTIGFARHRHTHAHVYSYDFAIMSSANAISVRINKDEKNLQAKIRLIFDRMIRSIDSQYRIRQIDPDVATMTLITDEKEGIKRWGSWNVVHHPLLLCLPIANAVSVVRFHTEFLMPIF